MDRHIGVFDVGGPPPPLVPVHGDYVQMFGRLLGEGFRVSRIAAAEGELPEDPLAFDGYMITGSKLGVLDGHAFIAPLSAFLRGLRGQRPVVGICFGHQLLAQAFGGTVAKSDRGWALGLKTYAMTEAADFARPGETVAIAASHQDQVIAPPADATVVMANAFTPFAGLSYDNGAILSFQPHPEFDVAYALDLLRFQNDAERLPRALIEQGLQSYGRPPDSARMAQWIRRCLQGGAVTPDAG